MEVERTYLELRDSTRLRPATPPPGLAVSLQRCEPCPVPRYRELYAGVGAPYRWHDRLAWSDAQLHAHLSSADVAVWVLAVGGVTAGYFELVCHGDASVEIAYFGLLPEFVGRGLGKWLLTRAVEHAWALGATRVWLQTCTLDHPAALTNYVARGFQPYRRERYTLPVTETN